MEINKGLIYTNEKCIGCNRCIYACPVMGANISKIENGNNRIYVDGDKCIHCGKCLEMCRHNARDYRDDTDRLFEDLKAGKKISLLIAPTFFINYSDIAGGVIGYLQHLGAQNAYNVSFGADIATWAYVKYLNESGKEGMLSQPCPAIVNYILKYKQELAENLIPIQSPMMCMAIYAKQYLNDDTSLAFISPCIAKKDEISSPDTYGYVTYNVSIQKLLDKLSGVNLSSYEGVLYDEKPQLGQIFPMAGGLMENLKCFESVDKMVRTVDGIDNCYRFLSDFSKRISEGKRLPYLSDILNCSEGCIFGTGVKEHARVSEDVIYSMHDKEKNIMSIYDDGENPYTSIISEKERKMRLYDKFKDLSVSDFLREYTPDYSIDDDSIISYDENEIFNSMYKFTDEDRKIDCHSCGYDSCKEMVKAIACGYNYKMNCVHYVKDENLRLYLTDTLSGIPNTNAFMKRCNEIISSGKGADYFAIYFNIRNMKIYNRKYGSKTGDVILSDYSKLVHHIATGDELVARWGGDNFVGIFLKEHKDYVLEKLDDIVVSVARPEGKEDEIKLGFRAAIYMLTGEERFAGQVMGQVTTTYATIKQSKKNIIYFSEELGKRILHDTMIEEMLEPALKAQEFVVYYQPKVSMETNDMVGAEALVRWIHDGKVISPGEFIPICENNGFVQRIDFYVLEKVCRDIREWLDKGIGMVKISFNFSKQHFVERDIAEKIDALASKYNIPRDYLEVEFTETAYIDEYDNLVETVDKLRNYEICSSIDDFGTGYSSLSLLQNVKFHTLKLDKSFLNRQTRNERNKAVIASIIKMAKELNMNIVAEGIETNEEYKYLKQLSCDIAQGFLFDRPLPKLQFEDRLKNKHYSESLISD